MYVRVLQGCPSPRVLTAVAKPRRDTAKVPLGPLGGLARLSYISNNGWLRLQLPHRAAGGGSLVRKDSGPSVRCCM